MDGTPSQGGIDYVTVGLQLLYWWLTVAVVRC